MTDPMTSKPLPWSDLPEEEKARLKRNEAAQRRETKKRGLPALPISPEGLWLVQRGMCTCNECRGTVPLEVGDTVIAHPHFRAGKGSPGHVPTNVSLWRKACNAREAGPETSALGRGRRLAVDLNRKGSEPSRGRSSIQGRGFQSKSANYVSPLSREYREKMKRKIES